MRSTHTHTHSGEFKYSLTNERVLLCSDQFMLREQWRGCSGGITCPLPAVGMITDAVMTGRKECVSNAAWNLHLNWTKQKESSLTAYIDNTAVITLWRHHQNAVGGASCWGETEVSGQRRDGRSTCPGRFPSNETGSDPAEEEVFGPLKEQFTQQCKRSHHHH